MIFRGLSPFTSVAFVLFTAVWIQAGEARGGTGPRIEFSARETIVSEPQGNVTLTLSRSGNSAKAAKVAFRVKPATALAGSDYLSQSGTVRFAAGETSKEFNVSVADDSEGEFEEMFSVVLQNPEGAALGTVKEHMVVIRDDDPLPMQRVSFTETGRQLSRSAESPVVSRDGRYVAFSYIGDFAADSDSGLLLSDRLTGDVKRLIPTGLGQVSIRNVRISPDGGKVVFTSSSQSFADGASDPVDNTYLVDVASGAISLLPSQAVVADGGRFLAYPVRESPSFFAIFVEDLESGETERVSISSDGTPADGSSVIDGISADGRYVSFQSLATNLTAEGNPSGQFARFVRDRLTGETIRVGTPFDSVRFVQGGYLVFRRQSVMLEGQPVDQLSCLDSRTGETQLITKRSDGVPANGGFSGVETSADGRLIAFASTATNIDSEPNNTRLKAFLHDRVTGQTVRLDARPDGVDANGTLAGIGISEDGRFAIFGSSSSNLVPEDSNQRVDIFVVPVAGALKGTYAITGERLITPEQPGTVLVPVRRTEASEAGRLSFEIQAGAASPDSDYTPVSGTLDFAIGEFEKVIAIPILDDELVEENESFTVRLLAATGGALLGASVESKVTILDDDGPATLAAEFSAAGFEEGVGIARINIVRTGGAGQSIAARFETIAGIAVPDSDYISASGTVEFGANEIEQTIPVRLIDDLNVEGNESFGLRLFSDSDPELVAEPSFVTVTVLDIEPSILDQAGHGLAAIGTEAVSSTQTNFSVRLFIRHYLESTSNPGVVRLVAKARSWAAPPSVPLPPDLIFPDVTFPAVPADSMVEVIAGGPVPVPPPGFDYHVIATILEESVSGLVVQDTRQVYVNYTTSYVFPDGSAVAREPVNGGVTASAVGFNAPALYAPPGLESLTIEGPAVVTEGVPARYKARGRLGGKTVVLDDVTWKSSAFEISNSGGLVPGNVDRPTQVQISVTASTGKAKLTGTKKIKIRPAKVPTITNPGVLLAGRGVPFRAQLTASNQPISFGIQAEVPLPAGLALNPRTGVVSGTLSEPGDFIFGATATNLGGTSARTLRVRVVEPGTLRIRVEGKGKITNGFAGASERLIGEEYTVAARPADGWLFAGWSGGLSSDNQRLTFEMSAGLEVVATFIRNPFGDLRGQYTGLITDGAVAAKAVGLASFSVTPAGAFSGSVKLGGISRKVKGSFTSLGTFAATLDDTETASLELMLDPSGTTQQIRGTLVLPGGTFAITADRSVFSGKRPAPQKGRYTVILPRPEGSSPFTGHGFGQVVVSVSGRVKFTGVLGDGTAVSNGVQLSARATWPLYLTLGENGALFLAGEVSFRDREGSDLDGALNGMVCDGSGDIVPLGGLLLGSRYVPRAVDYSSSDLHYEETGDVEPTVLELSIDPRGRMVSPESASLRGKLDVQTGLFSGSFNTDPGTETRFNGVLYQKTGSGSGRLSTGGKIELMSNAAAN